MFCKDLNPEADSAVKRTLRDKQAFFFWGKTGFCCFSGFLGLPSTSWVFSKC